MNDPIIEEVRKIRDEYAKRFNYDLDAICKDLQEKQERPEKNVVSFPFFIPLLSPPSTFISLGELSQWGLL